MNITSTLAAPTRRLLAGLIVTTIATASAGAWALTAGATGPTDEPTTTSRHRRGRDRRPAGRRSVRSGARRHSADRLAGPTHGLGSRRRRHSADRRRRPYPWPWITVGAATRPIVVADAYNGVGSRSAETAPTRSSLPTPTTASASPCAGESARRPDRRRGTPRSPQKAALRHDSRRPLGHATTSNRFDERLRFASRRRVLAFASAPVRQMLGAVAERRPSGSRHAGTSVGQIAAKLVVGRSSSGPWSYSLPTTWPRFELVTGCDHGGGRSVQARYPGRQRSATI